MQPSSKDDAKVIDRFDSHHGTATYFEQNGAAGSCGQYHSVRLFHERALTESADVIGLGLYHRPRPVLARELLPASLLRSQDLDDQHWWRPEQQWRWKDCHRDS